MKIKVCHLARIPCANSGLECSNLINKYSTKYESRYILGSDYSKGNDSIPFRAFPTDLNWQTQKEECLKVIKEAEIIHVHHDWYFEEIEPLLVGKKVIVTLYNLTNSLQYRDDEFNRRYIARMKKHTNIITVADQPLQKKMFSDVSTTLVPLVKNLFNENTEKSNQIPHIVFAPTNKERNGIGKKMYYEVLDIIKKLFGKYQFTFDLIEGVPYEENLERKRKADIIIDDVDPEYEKNHNTSIEAACFGAVPLTNYSSKEYPFHKTNLHNLENTLIVFLTNSFLLKSAQKKIIKWRQENYTPEKVLAVYEKLYNIEKEKFILPDLTVFLVTCGNNPNYDACYKALQNQTTSFKLEIIKDVAPMSAAFQCMLDKCTTPFYIQIDNDMVLEPNAINIMYEEIQKTDSKTSMVCFRLLDTHLNQEIQGVKIYKHDIFKQYPYQDCLSCEMNQLNRMEKDGYNYLADDRVLGQHSPYWTEEGIFDRYFIFMQKTDLKKLPQELLNIYLKNPTNLNWNAILGAIAGILSKEKMSYDKDFRDTNFSYMKLKNYFQEGSKFQFLPDIANKAISLQEFLKRLNESKLKYWFGFESCLEVVEKRTIGIVCKKIIIGINKDEKLALDAFLKKNNLVSMQENVYQYSGFSVQITEDSRVTETCKLPCFDLMVNVPKPVFPYLSAVLKGNWGRS